MINVSNKDINALAIPAIISGLIEPIISLTDVALVGNNLDYHAIAGVGIGSYTIVLFIWIFSSIRNSTTSIVSQLYGAGEKETLNSITSKSLLISFLLGIIIVIISNVLAPWIFKFQNAEGITLENSLTYFRIRSVAIPFTLATLSLFGAFKGFQNTHWAMRITLMGGLLNIVLDILFIKGLAFIPALGVSGVALASLISQVTMFLIALYFFLKNFKFSVGKTDFIDKSIGSLFYMSVDLLIRAIALNAVFILTNKFATKYGDQYMAAHTILFWIWIFQSYFIDGYSNAAMALSGKIKGQKRFGLLYRLGMKICKINFLLSLALAILLFFATPWIGVFTDNVRVEQLLGGSLYIVLLTFPLGSLAFTFDGIYIGLGKAYFLRNLLLISTFFIFVPCLYFLNNLGLTLDGIWLSILLWLCIRGLVPFIHFQGKYQSYDKL